MSEMNAETAGRQTRSLGDEIVGRINRLGTISETPEHLARIFLTSEHRAAAELILAWMGEAGMQRASRRDRKCLRPLRRRTAGFAVPDAGLALRHGPRRRQMGRSARTDHGDLLRRRSAQKRAPIAVRRRGDGFADEEGVRFASTLLGSRAVAGTFNESVLASKDSAGISMRDALHPVRSRPRPYRRGGTDPKRTAGLCRTSHRAGAGTGSPEPAGRAWSAPSRARRVWRQN